MSSNKTPYWIRVLAHFERQHYISNGLTIPFLIGCRSKVYPLGYLFSIDEFLWQLALSKYKVTLMTCRNIGHVVIGTMDLETKGFAEEGGYRNFGSLYITDDSFKDSSNLDEIILECKRLYESDLKLEHYSLVDGRWSKYSEVDEKRLSEVSELAVEEMLSVREDNDSDRLNGIFDMFSAGKLHSIIPLWHIDVTTIDLDDQPHNLPALRRSRGFEIIWVDFELLLNNMFPEQADVFRQKILFHDLFSQRNIARIIGHWMNNEKLIPPTITFEERPDRNLFPADGKHRLNIAYYFGATRIPILILSSEKNKISQLVNR